METPYNIILIDDRNKLSKLDILEEDAIVNKSARTYCIGFDAEFISKSNHPNSFKKCRNWVIDTPTNEAVCLIQIASKKYVFLIYLPGIGLPLPKKLKKIFLGEKWLKTGVGIEGDLRKICDNYKLSHFHGSFELKTLAEVGNIKKPNLVNLYSLFVGKQHYKDKSQSVCDWSLPLRESKKIKYAARDAIMSYQLFQYMLEPTLNHIISKSESKLDVRLEINIENDLNINENLEKKEDTQMMIETHLNSSDIDKLSGIILSEQVKCPDLSYIEPSLNKTRYSKLRKTARFALKRCNSPESKIMNQIKVTLINGCQIQGYSSNICNSLCKKLTCNIKNYNLFEPQVIKHVENLYKNNVKIN